MERLIAQAQHYDWGSRSILPELMGLEPDGRPWAELWIGDHPRLPSLRTSNGEALDVGLTFLLKILTAASPLSIQSHPSLSQAEAGFARENAAGVPLDAAHRTYRDANHKPEMVCALTRFEALCGFRDPAEAAAELDDVSGLETVAAKLRNEGLRSTVTWLLQRDSEEATQLCRSAATGSELSARLEAQYPGDPGVVVALLLNHLVLEPGEALFLGAGNLHAYLEGAAVEIMANSDNVVRGGLTPKHIDVAELLRIVDFSPLAPVVQRPAADFWRFDSPVADFALTRVELGETRSIPVDVPHLVLCTSGTIQLRSRSGHDLALASGQSAIVEAADEAFTMACQSGETALGWIAGPGESSTDSL